MRKRRKVGISSHQFYTEGYLIGYSEKNGVLYAVVENEHGITTYEIPSCYSIEFL